MLVVRNVCAVALAAVLLDSGRSGQSQGALEDLVSADNPLTMVDLAWSLGSIGDRSGMNAIRTLLFKGV